MKFMKTEEFRQWYKERYKIEAKNSELKHSYGYVEALYYGITGLKYRAQWLYLHAIFPESYGYWTKNPENKRKNGSCGQKVG